jgi:hypothetical protein
MTFAGFIRPTEKPVPQKRSRIAVLSDKFHGVNSRRSPRNRIQTRRTQWHRSRRKIWLPPK